MDTRFYVSREEFHNVQMDVRQLQAVQSSQAERLQRLEKRQQDDAAIRSAWSTSPFPSAIVGTPSHGPLRIPSTENFDLDDQSQTLGSLHLEPDDEPIRRATSASRANSVRFDESANLAQSGRSFNDIGAFRPGSGMLMERSLSHKSDGRHSSAGHSVHSVHSVVSGRGSSIGLDTTFMTGGNDQDSPIDMPEPPPVFYILGSVPAIVRCWLTKDFASSTLLYAAICTGARGSTIEFSLVKELGLNDLVYREVDSTYKIHLQAYLAEALPDTKSINPVPHIPFLGVNFEVVGMAQYAESEVVPASKKAIRVFIGSDALRAHSADVLFSRNVLSLYSSEREKLTVPFVRPEDDGVFRNLATSNAVPDRPKLNAAAAEFVLGGPKSTGSANDEESLPHTRLEDFNDELVAGSLHDSVTQQYRGRQLRFEHIDRSPSRNGPSIPIDTSSYNAEAVSPTTTHAIPTAKWNSSASGAAFGATSGATSGAASGAVSDAPSGAVSESDADNEKGPRNQAVSAHSGKEARSRDSSGVWGSWRQGGSAPAQDRDNGPLSGYQPASRSRTMKVLKAKSSNGSNSVRTGASYEPVPPPRTSGEHRRKSQGHLGAGANGNEGGGSSGGQGPSAASSNFIRWESKRSISSSNAAQNGGASKENKGQSLAALDLRGGGGNTSATRTANPIGGASAFAWMKSKSKTASE